KMRCQVLSEIDRAMLAASAAERNHQVPEATALVIAHAGIDQSRCMGQELMRALLLIKVFDHRSVFAGEILETLFAAWIGNSASVKNKSAAIACFIARRSTLMERKAEYPDSEFRHLRRRALWFFQGSSKAQQLRRIQHGCKRAEQRRQRDWQLDIIQQPLK